MSQTIRTQYSLKLLQASVIQKLSATDSSKCHEQVTVLLLYVSELETPALLIVS